MYVQDSTNYSLELKKLHTGYCKQIYLYFKKTRSTILYSKRKVLENINIWVL